uniref:Uncharacterized protein n=1 Tax=Oryza sativa subsp. japonica TaxID=39947 RepID=Q6YWM7_ORYSJ|nr:hypothetical protein [Oryza sativa Japonica Group]BAD20164.1 hypothetical protein [Oryza sativa Japonica Group]
MAAGSDGKLAGDWMVGCEFGGHLHVEGDDANPMAAAASGGDGGDGAAAQPKTAGGGGGLNGGGAAARRHGRPRERGQTKEGDEGVTAASSSGASDGAAAASAASWLPSSGSDGPLLVPACTTTVPGVDHLKEEQTEAMEKKKNRCSGTKLYYTGI